MFYLEFIGRRKVKTMNLYKKSPYYWMIMGPVVKNLPANAREIGSISGLGHISIKSTSRLSGVLSVPCEG